MMRGERQLAAICKVLDSPATDLARIVMIRQSVDSVKQPKLPKSMKAITFQN